MIVFTVKKNMPSDLKLKIYNLGLNSGFPDHWQTLYQMDCQGEKNIHWKKKKRPYQLKKIKKHAIRWSKKKPQFGLLTGIR